MQAIAYYYCDRFTTETEIIYVAPQLNKTKNEA